MTKDNLNTSGIVPLSYAVYSYSNEIGDSQLRDYERLLQLVIDCYAMMNIYNSSAIDVAYLKMNDNGVIDLAKDVPDYIEYTKIGIVQNGKIVILGLNENIVFRRDTMNVGQARSIFKGDTANTPDEGFFFAPHYSGSSYVPALYGVGGGFSRAYYRIDKSRRQIQFDTIVPNNEIVLEYKSTGIKTCEQSLIPRQAVPVLVAYIYWTLAKGDKRVPMNQKLLLKGEYEGQLKRYTFLEYAPTIKEYMDTLHSSYRQSPKR